MTAVGVVPAQDAAVRVPQRLGSALLPAEHVADLSALYFGVVLDDRSVVPGDGARIGPTRLDDWLARSKQH